MSQLKFIFVILFIPAISFSQKIKVNEIDKFTKKKRIETSYSYLKMGLFQYLGANIRSADSSIFINIQGSGAGSFVIGTDDPVIFLLDNDSTIKIFPTDIQTYSIGIGSSRDTYSHQYYISLSDLKTLSNHNIKSVRKHGSSSYVDIDINEKNQDEFKKNALLFLKEFEK